MVIKYYLLVLLYTFLATAKATEECNKEKRKIPIDCNTMIPNLSCNESFEYPRECTGSGDCADGKVCGLTFSRIRYTREGKEIQEFDKMLQCIEPDECYVNQCWPKSTKELDPDRHTLGHLNTLKPLCGFKKWKHENVVPYIMMIVMGIAIWFHYAFNYFNREEDKY